MIGPIYQMAFVVPDLGAAIAAWTADRLAGPFYRFDHFAFEPAELQGSPPPVDISIALGHSGALNIELIELHGAPSDLFGGAGLHHIARRADDVDTACARLAAAGAPSLLRARFAGGVDMAYVDTRSTLGCITELIARDAGIDAMLARMASEAAGWDGRNPVRRF